MKTIYLSLLFLCSGLTVFAQKTNRIAVHVEAGVKYDVKSNLYSGYDFNSQEEGFSGVQFFVSGLYPLSNNFAAGVGVGVNIYTRYDAYFDGITSVPVYANAVYKLPTSGDFIPFVDLKLGYGIVSRNYVLSPSGSMTPFEDQDFNVKNSGGIYVSPSLGILFPLNDNAFSVSLSYDLQKMHAELSDLSHSKTSKHSKVHSKTLALRIGFIF